MNATRKGTIKEAPALSALPDFPGLPEISAFDKDAPAKVKAANQKIEVWWRDVVRLLSEQQQAISDRLYALESK